jgi:hypothetical protein
MGILFFFSFLFVSFPVLSAPCVSCPIFSFSRPTLLLTWRISLYGFGVAARVAQPPHQICSTPATFSATSTPRPQNQTQNPPHILWGGSKKYSNIICSLYLSILIWARSIVSRQVTKQSSASFKIIWGALGLYCCLMSFFLIVPILACNERASFGYQSLVCLFCSLDSVIFRSLGQSTHPSTA